MKQKVSMTVRESLGIALCQGTFHWCSLMLHLTISKIEQIPKGSNKQTKKYQIQFSGFSMEEGMERHYHSGSLLLLVCDIIGKS